MVERVCAAQIEVSKNPELAEQYKETFAYYPENGSLLLLTAAVKMVGDSTVC